MQSKSAQIILTLFALFFAATSAQAACSDKKVKRLSADGNTVAEIAKACKMDEDDVQDVLGDEPDPEPKPDAKKGLPSGAPVGQCGCWGPADPSYRQPANQCRSGYAHPQACNAVCPAGGLMWQGVCG